MSKQMNVIARITPKRAHLDDAREAIRGILDTTRAEPGCIEFRLSEDTEEGVLYLYEEWRDPHALAAHHAQPYTRRVFEAYETWLDEAPQIAHLQPVS